jgi:hypothetical protein
MVATHSDEIHRRDIAIQESKDRISFLESELDSMKVTYFNNLEAATQSAEAKTKAVSAEASKAQQELKLIIANLREEHHAFRREIADLKDMLQNREYHEEQEEEWQGYEEEEEEEYQEQDQEDTQEYLDEIEEPKSTPDLQKAFTEFLTKFASGSKDDDSTRSKEADSIKIPPLPTASQFKAWKLSVRSTVSSASKNPEEAFQWILEVEDKDASYEKMHECHKKFETLDAKLAASLTNVCKGELSRKVILKTEEEAKAKRLIRGRQILWLMYEEYRINEEAGSLMDLSDLMKVILKKEHSKVEHLSRFMMNWDSVLAGMKNPPGSEDLQVMLFEQIKHVPCLSTDIAIYERASPGSEDRSYEFLTKAIRRILEKNKQEKNRKDIVKSLESMNDNNKGSINAVKGGKSKGKGKGSKGKGASKGEKGKGKGKTGKGGKGDTNCRQWMAEQVCSKGSACWYNHPTIDGWTLNKKTGAKAKAKSKPARSNTVCKWFAAGKCNKGDKCNESHDIPTIAPLADKPRRPKAKAKPAGAEAVPKGNEQVN